MPSLIYSNTYIVFLNTNFNCEDNDINLPLFSHKDIEVLA